MNKEEGQKEIECTEKKTRIIELRRRNKKMPYTKIN
jgi:hypothetical protein